MRNGEHVVGVSGFSGSAVGVSGVSGVSGSFGLSGSGLSGSAGVFGEKDFPVLSGAGVSKNNYSNVNQDNASDSDVVMRDQPTGAAASRYASLPPSNSQPVISAKKISVGSSQTDHTAAVTTQTSVAQPSFADMAKKNVAKPVAVRRKKLSARQTEALVRRTFVVPSADDVEGFRYVYFTNRHQEALSKMRLKLSKLRVNNWRILDIHYPARHVVAFLTHNEYYPTLLELFDKVGVKPITDFDPFDVQHVEDPAVAALEGEELAFKIAEMNKGRLLRALKYLKKEIKRPDGSVYSRPGFVAKAVAKHFCDHHNWINSEELRNFYKFGAFTETDITDEDDAMADVRQSFIAPTEDADEESLSGDGEPADTQ
jgi:hypothetical protein